MIGIIGQLESAADSRFAGVFREHLRRVVEDETGLPPCEEVDFMVTRDHARREHVLTIQFPGKMVAIHSFADMQLLLLSLEDQMQMVETAIRIMARDWKCKLS